MAESLPTRITLTHAEVYTDDAGEYRWRVKATNGRTLADSGEGYVDKRDLFRALALVTDKQPTISETKDGPEPGPHAIRVVML